MKKAWILLTALLLLLSGCAVIRDTGEIGSPVPVSDLDMRSSEYSGRVEKAAVYFLNEQARTLTAEIRTLVVGHDENPAETAVDALLEGPQETEGLTGVAPAGMRLSFIEFSRDIANVYLIYDGAAMAPKQKFILELAIANTVTDILGASYISVFYNGSKAGFSGYPSAPVRKQTGSVDEAWIQASGKYLPDLPAAVDEAAQNEADAPLASTSPAPSPTPTPPVQPPEPTPQPEPVVSEITTILYFVSTSGDFILPEVRNVTYTDGNYIDKLIEELKKGPQDTVSMTSPLKDDLEVMGEPELTDIGNGYRLSLDFNKLPAQNDFTGSEDAVRSYAALLYTITGFVPNITSVDLSVQGQRIIDVEGVTQFYDGMQRSDFTGMIGSSAPIYFTDQNSDLLLEVPRSMEQRQIWSARMRVLEILKGPLTGDAETARPVMPAGITEEDIISVDVYEDTAYVNVSAHFKEVSSGFSAKNEMLLVYSIVNTVTAMDGVVQVQFLVEGEQTDTLAGALCISDPFLRNYGIIKESG